MRPAYRLRQVVNAVNFATLAGLVVAKAQHGRLERGPDGLVLARGTRGRLPVASAFTIGNVIVVRDGVALTDDLLAHEASHATQWACCVLIFLPLYAGAAAWSWVRTGDHWSRNVFERRAGLARGGYLEHPSRRAQRRGTQAG